jgi:hypothetical protein
MQPYQAKIYIYADSQEQVSAFESAFNQLVNDKRQLGIAVSAEKLLQAIDRFGGSFFINHYLK